MLSKYTKRFSLSSYGGINWNWLTGFEQVVTNGVPTYYAIDFGQNAPFISRIVIFNQFWIYQGYHDLPYYATYTTKYVGGFFYFSSASYFYKTNTNFEVINYYQDNAYYKQFFYDSTVSKFYVASQAYPRIDVFDTFCSRLQSISLGSNLPYGLASYNANIYAGIQNSNQVLVIQNGFH